MNQAFPGILKKKGRHTTLHTAHWTFATHAHGRSVADLPRQGGSCLFNPNHSIFDIFIGNLVYSWFKNIFIFPIIHLFPLFIPDPTIPRPFPRQPGDQAGGVQECGFGSLDGLSWVFGFIPAGLCIPILPLPSPNQFLQTAPWAWSRHSRLLLGPCATWTQTQLQFPDLPRRQEGEQQQQLNLLTAWWDTLELDIELPKDTHLLTLPHPLPQPGRHTS